MNGAESLVATLVDGGIEVCFSNPGTSEMHFVAALDEVPGMRCVLGLFEGVVSGAADGYARMARKPAATLLHLGPGLGNALANIHNAKKGGVPMLNIVGDHAVYHLRYDAPLTSDIAGIAGPVSHWVHSAQSPAEIASAAAEAVVQTHSDHIATLILPADVSWGDNPEGAAAVPAKGESKQVPAEVIEAVAEKLRSGARCMLFAGGKETDEQRTLMLSRIGKASSARVCMETFPTRVARGAGTGVLERLPYFAELAIDQLKEVQQLIVVGCQPPVAFFAYPNVASVMTQADCEITHLAQPGENIDLALEALLERLDAIDVKPDVQPLQVPELCSGALDVNAVATAVAHFMPENAIVVDEAITASLVCMPMTENAQPHDWLSQTGGSIGWGLPAAVGAAIAQPQRKVLCLEGDGSAMYTLQALWTMARENLDVTVVIFNNSKYSILEVEFTRTGARGGKPGPNAASMLDIAAPAMDFVAMAKGMGVNASTASTAEEFNQQLAAALQAPGPHLIDAIVPPLV